MLGISRCMYVCMLVCCVSNVGVLCLLYVMYVCSVCFSILSMYVRVRVMLYMYDLYVSAYAMLRWAMFLWYVVHVCAYVCGSDRYALFSSLVLCVYVSYIVM